MIRRLFSSQLRINMVSGVGATKEVIALPIYPALTKEQIEEVVKAIKSS